MAEQLSHPKQITRPGLLEKIYTHNPFYAISAALMFYSLRTMFGDLEIGEINTWMMMGGIAGYTLILAILGWMIVRFGKVWEDARSIAVILLFLFMGISVSADDLFVRTDGGGTSLIILGYLFSATISELFLKGTGIRLGLLYRLPYHLMLATFFITPWYYSPLQNPRFSDRLEWHLFLFPFISAGLFLALYPAVLKGAEYVRHNGTPWKWPLFPWTIFVVFACLFGLRSYIVCMAFGPTGPIWDESGSSKSIVFDSMWGLYFLVPLLFVLTFLVMEYSHQSDNRKLEKKTVLFLPVLVLMSLPVGGGAVSNRFYHSVADTYGSPIWWTLWGVGLFYLLAWFRKIPESGFGLVASLLLLSVVSRETVNPDTLTDPVAWPLITVGILVLYKGIVSSSSHYCSLASLILSAGICLAIPETVQLKYRIMFGLHLFFVMLGVCGLFLKDYFADLLRMTAGVMGAVLYFIVVVPEYDPEISFALKLGYACLMIGGTFFVSLWRKSKSFLFSFALMLLISGYGLLISVFRFSARNFGHGPVSTFIWSIAALMLAFLISSHKASWLPEKMLKKKSSSENVLPQS